MITTECIESKKGLTPNGYSRIRVGHVKVQAHRWAYELVHGKIPAGLVIDHMCENRLCIAPDHLRAITQSENVRAGKHSLDRKPFCRKGHLHSVHLVTRKNGKRECGECNRIRARKKA